MPESLHIDIPNDQIHPPKDFSAARIGTFLVKGESGALLWENRADLPNVIEFVDATLTPPSPEKDGDAYALVGTPHANWDGALANDFVRYDGTLDTWFSITPREGFRVYDAEFEGTWVFAGGTEGWRGELFTISKTIASAEVLALFSTPIEIVKAPLGKSIVVVDWLVETTFTTPAYATEDTLYLITDTATRPQGIDDESLQSTVSRIRKGNVADTGDGWGAADTQIISSKKLELTTDSANPTAGNSDLTIRVNFRLI